MVTKYKEDDKLNANDPTQKYLYIVSIFNLFILIFVCGYYYYRKKYTRITRSSFDRECSLDQNNDQSVLLAHPKKFLEVPHFGNIPTAISTAYPDLHKRHFINSLRKRDLFRLGKMMFYNNMGKGFCGYISVLVDLYSHLKDENSHVRKRFFQRDGMFSALPANTPRLAKIKAEYPALLETFRKMLDSTKDVCELLNEHPTVPVRALQYFILGVAFSECAGSGNIENSFLWLLVSDTVDIGRWVAERKIGGPLANIASLSRIKEVLGDDAVLSEFYDDFAAAFTCDSSKPDVGQQIWATDGHFRIIAEALDVSFCLLAFIGNNNDVHIGAIHGPSYKAAMESAERICDNTPENTEEIRKALESKDFGILLYLISMDNFHFCALVSE